MSRSSALTPQPLPVARSSPGLPAWRSASRGDSAHAGATARCSTTPRRPPGPAPQSPGAVGFPCGRWQRGPGLLPPPRSRFGSVLGVPAQGDHPASRPERARLATTRVQPGPCSQYRRRGRARETKKAGLRLPLKGRVSRASQVARGDSDAARVGGYCPRGLGRAYPAPSFHTPDINVPGMSGSR